jgi:hypothetical protein
MKKNILISPIGLKGNEINERMKQLMGITPINENKSDIAVELTKIGPDGKAYAIIRENHEWYIKKSDKTKNLIANDFKYIGGLQNKKQEAYPSYAKAIKHLNLKFRSLAEAYNYDGDINVFLNDNLLNENMPMAGGFSEMKGNGFTGHGNMEENMPMDEMYMDEVEMTEYEKAIDEMLDGDDEEIYDLDEIPPYTGPEDYMQNQVTEKKFPDLTGDGKVTRADILKGRGVDLNESKLDSLIENIIRSEVKKKV